MRKGGGRPKGNAYQGKVAKPFSEWWGCKVASTPGSGGWHHAESFDLKGDLVATDPSFPFFIECKNQECWSFDMVMKSPDSNPVVVWWEKAMEQAASQSQFPLLVFRKNHFVDCIIIKLEDLENVMEAPQAAEIGWVFSMGKVLVSAMKLDDFLEISPDAWRSALNLPVYEGDNSDVKVA